ITVLRRRAAMVSRELRAPALFSHVADQRRGAAAARLAVRVAPEAARRPEQIIAGDAPARPVDLLDGEAGAEEQAFGRAGARRSDLSLMIDVAHAIFLSLASTGGSLSSCWVGPSRGARLIPSTTRFRNRAPKKPLSAADLITRISATASPPSS